MHAVAQPVPMTGRLGLWTGRVLSGLVVAFLLFDGLIKVILIQPVVDAMEKMGYPPKYAVMIGIIDLACAVLYAIPRTSVLGALLMTALLGGAVSEHVRTASPLFSHTLFGVYLGIVAWAGLYLREPRLRDLLPLRS